MTGGPASTAVPQVWRDEVGACLNPVPVRLCAEKGRPAAVLVGLIQRQDEWHVIMTKRAGHLAHHAGQISFPGGKVDPADASLTAAALREADEEIALPPAAVTVLGALDVVISPVGFVVQPVVGIVETMVELVAAPQEVESVLLLPLAVLMDRKRHRRESYLRAGEKREVWVIDHEDHYLWGLSASILVDLASRLEPLDAKGQAAG